MKYDICQIIYRPSSIFQDTIDKECSGTCDNSVSSVLSEKLKSKLTSLILPINRFICAIAQQTSTYSVSILHTLDFGCLQTFMKLHSPGIAGFMHRLLFKHCVSDTCFVPLFRKGLGFVTFSWRCVLKTYGLLGCDTVYIG